LAIGLRTLLILIVADAPVIMVGFTIFALLSRWFTPESEWLPKTRITHFIDSTGEGDAATASEGISEHSIADTGTKVN